MAKSPESPKSSPRQSQSLSLEQSQKFEYPIERLRAAVAWADWNYETYWIPDPLSGRKPPTVEQILLAHTLVTEVLGLDSIEAALTMQPAEIVPAFGTYDFETEPPTWRPDLVRHEAALPVIEKAQNALRLIFGVPIESAEPAETGGS